MRVGLVLGIGSIVAAYVIGAIHQTYTGDTSISRLVWQGVLAACVMGLLVTLRLGIPNQLRAYQLKRALRQRSRPARSA